MDVQHLTLEAVNALFQEMGAPVVVVSDPAQATPEVNTDELLAEIDKSREPILKAKIGDAITKESRTAMAGVINGSMRSGMLQLLKAKGVTGVTNKDLENLSDKELLAFGLEQVERSTGKSGDELRAAMEEMSNTHQKEIADLTTSKDAEIQAVKDEVENGYNNSYLFGVVDKVPRIGGDTAEQTQAFERYLRANYVPRWNAEKKATELRDKNNPETLALTAAGGKIVTPEEAAKTYFEKQGILKTDNRHTNPSDAMQNAGYSGQPQHGQPPADVPMGTNAFQNDVNRLTANAQQAAA